MSKDLNAVQEALAAVPEWDAFFKSPVIENAERLETLNELWGKIGASEVTRQFFAQLVESRQTRHVKEMIHNYQQILRSKKGELEATVVSARPLTAKDTEKLRAAIADQFGGSGRVILKQEIDPSLLAGFTLTVGNTYVDLSVKSQIEEIEGAYRTILNAHRENALQRTV